MLDKTSSIICAFGLASAAPRSPYRHLELCGIALVIIHYFQDLARGSYARKKVLFVFEKSKKFYEARKFLFAILWTVFFLRPSLYAGQSKSGSEFFLGTGFRKFPTYHLLKRLIRWLLLCIVHSFFLCFSFSYLQTSFYLLPSFAATVL